MRTSPASRQGAGGLPLAVTIGEPAGIGPDVILRALAQEGAGLPPLFLIGDCALLHARARQIGLAPDLCAVDKPDALPPIVAVSSAGGPVPVLGWGGAVDHRPGMLNRDAAQYVIKALHLGVSCVRAGLAGALVTGPIHKGHLLESGFRFAGHTEFLEASAHKAGPGEARAVMLMHSPQLRIVPVTRHIALSAVPATLTTETIIHAGRVTLGSLRHRFGLATPRLAVCGLNPHAGEDGAFGDEEERVIKPAIAALQAEGACVRGPHGADSLFHEAARTDYDCVLAMYHDQALIAVKTLAFHECVNVTLGLDIIRTSPDHGTALDIAGTGRANPASMIAALHLAARLAPMPQPLPEPV